MSLVSWVSEFFRVFSGPWHLTSSERLIDGTTSVPRKNVEILFAMKELGVVGLTDPPWRLKPVSSRNKITSTKARPWSPMVHQNTTGQSTCCTMKPPNVGPATVPIRKLSEKTRNALPRSCKKNRSVIKLAPSMDGTEPNIPAKRRDMTKGSYWFESVIQAAQILHATAPTRLHQMVEHLPMNLARGTKKSGPKAIPATAADIYKDFLNFRWET